MRRRESNLTPPPHPQVALGREVAAASCQYCITISESAPAGNGPFTWAIDLSTTGMYNFYVQAY